MLSGVQEKLRRVPGEHSNAKYEVISILEGRLIRLLLLSLLRLFLQAPGQPCHDVPDQGDMINQRLL